MLCTSSFERSRRCAASDGFVEAFVTNMACARDDDVGDEEEPEEEDVGGNHAYLGPWMDSSHEA